MIKIGEYWTQAYYSHFVPILYIQEFMYTASQSHFDFPYEEVLFNMNQCIEYESSWPFLIIISIV